MSNFEHKNGFFVAWRLYAPKKEFFEKTCMLPDVEKVP
jgi:hypothetical protein